MADTHAAPEAHGAKKGILTKVWGGVWIVLGVGLAILVALFVFEPFTGMGFDALGRWLHTFAVGMTNSGVEFGNMSHGIRSWSTSISKVMMAGVAFLAPIILIAIILALIFDEIRKEFKKRFGGGGGGHPPAAH